MASVWWCGVGTFGHKCWVHGCVGRVYLECRRGWLVVQSQACQGAATTHAGVRTQHPAADVKVLVGGCAAGVCVYPDGLVLTTACLTSTLTAGGRPLDMPALVVHGGV